MKRVYEVVQDVKLAIWTLLRDVARMAESALGVHFYRFNSRVSTTLLLICSVNGFHRVLPILYLDANVVWARKFDQLDY